MFDSAVRRIDFVESILTKNELKVKWFVFSYIRIKVGWTLNLFVKINSKFLIYKLKL